MKSKRSINPIFICAARFWMLGSPFSQWSPVMMRPDAKVKAVYLYPKPVDFRKSIDGLAALV